MKKITPFILAVLLLAVLSGSACFALVHWAKSWVPLQGKEKLIAFVQEQSGMHLSIEALTFDPPSRLDFKHLRLSQPDGRPSTYCPLGTLHINWLSSILYQSMAFSLSAGCSTPLPATVAFEGRIKPFSRTLVGNLESSPIDLKQLTAPLRDLLPAPLTAGILHPNLHVEFTGKKLALHGPLDVAQAEWQNLFTQANFVSKLAVEIPLNTPEPQWKGQITLHVHRAVLTLPEKQLPIANASLRVTPGAAWIDYLETHIDGRHFRVSGILLRRLGEVYSTLVLHTTDYTWVDLAKWLPPNVSISGKHNPSLQAHCVGLLPQAWQADCTTNIRADNLLFAMDPWESIDIKFLEVDFEHLSRVLNIRQALGLKNQAPVAAAGTLSLRPPSTLRIDVAHHLDFKRLPATFASVFLVDSGTAFSHLVVEGLLDQPQITGRSRINQVEVQTSHFPQKLTEGNGILDISEAAISTSGLSFLFGEVPVSLDGSYNRHYPNGFDAKLHALEHSLNASFYLEPDRIQVQEASLQGRGTHLRAWGRVEFPLTRESHFTVEGLLNAATLQSFDYKALRLHPIADGVDTARFDLNYKGPINDWTQSNHQLKALLPNFRYQGLHLTDVELEWIQSPQAQAFKIRRAACFPGWIHLDMQRVAQPRAPWHVVSDGADVPLDYFQTFAPELSIKPQSGVLSWHAELLTGDTLPDWKGRLWFKLEGNRLGSIPLLNRLFGEGFFGAIANSLGLRQLRHAQLVMANFDGHVHGGNLYSKRIELLGMSAGDYVFINAAGRIEWSRGLDSTLDLYLDPPAFQTSRIDANRPSLLKGTVLRSAGLLDRLRRNFGYARVSGTLSEPKQSFELNPDNLISTILWPFAE